METWLSRAPTRQVLMYPQGPWSTSSRQCDSTWRWIAVNWPGPIQQSIDTPEFHEPLQLWGVEQRKIVPLAK